MKLSDLHEGFMSLDVFGSDNAADLMFKAEQAANAAKKKLEKEGGRLIPNNVLEMKACEAAIEALTKGLEEEGNSYNTHGTLNVAMIIDEQFEEFRKFKQWRQLARDVAELLQNELDTVRKNDSQYTRKMKTLVKSLTAISGSLSATDK